MYALRTGVRSPVGLLMWLIRHGSDQFPMLMPQESILDEQQFYKKGSRPMLDLKIEFLQSDGPTCKNGWRKRRSYR